MDRELDQQIARLLGWTWNERSAWSPTGSMWARVKDADGQGPDDPWAWLPFYSTSIEAAWTVVEHLHAQGECLSLEWVLGPTKPFDEWAWVARFRLTSERAAIAPTAPLAICEAALRAVAALLAPGGREGGEGEDA